MKEYKVISDRFVEHLVEQLNQHGTEGWTIAAYVQEFALTKIILERDTN